MMFLIKAKLNKFNHKCKKNVIYIAITVIINKIIS